MTFIRMSDFNMAGCCEVGSFLLPTESRRAFLLTINIPHSFSSGYCHPDDDTNYLMGYIVVINSVHF